MIREPVVILANGDFPTHKVSLLILQDAGTIICCDGAANHLVRSGMEPHYILGDMDSIDYDLKNKYRNRIIELPNQDKNDLRKVIEWVEGKGIRKAIILGATGKREDHSLANIFTLLQYPVSLEISMYSNYGIFSAVQGEKIFDSFIGQQISIFSADDFVLYSSRIHIRLFLSIFSKAITSNA